MRGNHDDEFMDLYMMGAVDDHRGGKSPRKGGGGLTSFVLIVTFPIISIIGLCVLLS